MRILIIRHGDPDYKIDSLTEKGKREALSRSESFAHVYLGFSRHSYRGHLFSFVCVLSQYEISYTNPSSVLTIFVILKSNFP